jgi:hypothetical protein
MAVGQDVDFQMGQRGSDDLLGTGEDITPVPEKASKW